MLKAKRIITRILGFPEKVRQGNWEMWPTEWPTQWQWPSLMPNPGDPEKPLPLTGLWLIPALGQKIYKMSF